MPIENNHGLNKIKRETRGSLKLKQLPRLYDMTLQKKEIIYFETTFQTVLLEKE